MGLHMGDGDGDISSLKIKEIKKNKISGNSFL